MNTDKLTALWLDMSAARRADWDAQDLWAALKADPATTPDEWFRLWDRAALCAAERVRTLQAFTNAVKYRNRVAV
jgi:hypothetical protein